VPSTDRTRLLITFAGKKSYIYRPLAASSECDRIVAVDSDPCATISNVADHFEVVPRVDDEDAYEAELLDIGTRHDVHAILPLNDLDVKFLAARHERFRQAGIRVLCPELSIVETLLDKRKAADWFSNHGFKTPTTWTVSEALGQPSLPFPLVSKARFGQGSAGFKLCSTREEVSGLPDNTVLQPYLVGTHLDLDLLRSSSDVLAVIPKIKHSSTAGTCDRATTTVAPRYIEIGVRLCDAIGHVGAVDADLVDTNDGPVVLEVNPRLGGCFPFTALAAPRFVDALLRVARGASTEPFVGELEDGCTMCQEQQYFVGSSARTHS
jgi:carbamoyl-phosphate synthase large subunit